MTTRRIFTLDDAHEALNAITEILDRQNTVHTPPINLASEIALNACEAIEAQLEELGPVAGNESCADCQKLQDQVDGLLGWKQVLDGVPCDSGTLIGWMERAQRAEAENFSLREKLLTRDAGEED